MRAFFELLDTRGKLKKHMLWMVVLSVSYALIYQVISYGMYQLDQTAVLYVASYLLALLAGGIPAFVILQIQRTQEAVILNRKRILGSYLLIQTILYLIMSVLGYASFLMAARGNVRFMAYVVNAILVLAVLFYVPVQLFCFQKLKEGCHPFAMMKQAIMTILHQYQPVFYSCLILAILFVGYRYLMSALFQFQMGVALYDMPMELLTRFVPFLDVVHLATLISQNVVLLLPLCFALFFSMAQCFAFVLFLYYLACIQRKEEDQ